MWGGFHIELSKVGASLTDVLDFFCALRPRQQAFLNDLWIERRSFELSPDDKIFTKDCIFEVGKLGIAFKLDGDVFIILASITYSRFTGFTNECIKVFAICDTAFDNLSNQ